MNSSNLDFIDGLHFNENGLIPAIAQDWLDGAVLMLAWMNKESIERTIKSGEVHYWSRSRMEIWHKGETSGHFQRLKGIRYDCDADTILLTVQQVGHIACHTGKRSCFYKGIGVDENLTEDQTLPPIDACGELFRVINERVSCPVPNSYTNKLLKGGDNSILKKIGEESAEFVMACKDNEAESIANEAADLIFHIQVAIANHGVSWTDVLEVLASRRGAPRRS